MILWSGVRAASTDRCRLYLHRLIAFPESRRVLVIHLVATPFLAVQTAVVAMIPVLLRDYFRASEVQTTMSTAAIPVMLLLSVLWNEVYRRMRPGAYLVLLWIVAIAPLAGIAFCHSPEAVLVFVIISAAGFGAMTPLTGDILRSCYPPAVRSRVFSLLQMFAQAIIMIATYLIGVWLEIDQNAFRRYLPAAVVLIGFGMILLSRITREPIFMERHRATHPDSLPRSLSRAWHRMAEIFIEDRDFRRYETAFFVYGLGWMICHALLPFLVVDELNLNYEEVARSTQTTLQLSLLVTLLPIGHLMDRLGAIRLSAWAFTMLALYPVGLILARGVNTLMLATIIYGVALCGVQLAWTIGPVTLARHASQAPHYLAIHASMVGVRAIFGQFPAVLLYRATGDIRVPLALAMAAFFTGGLLMHRLSRDHRKAAVPPEEPVPMPPAHTRVP